jgi:hypothetical protein
MYRREKEISPKLLQLAEVDLTCLKRALTSTAHIITGEAASADTAQAFTATLKAGTE